MKLMIEIEKEDFETIVSKYDTFPAEMKRWGINAIKSGIPFPKGHGRLIDADVLKTAFPCGESVRTECVRATIDYAPTIIE